MISTVTVIQHVPFEQQTAVVERLRALTADGGHVIALENVSDQAPHVFSRSIGGWRTLFERAGFKSLAMRRYDYSACLRSLKRLMRVLPSTATPAGPDTAETLNAPRRPVAARSIGRPARLAVMRACTVVDGAIEPVCIRLGLAAPSVHCGFLFRAG